MSEGSDEPEEGARSPRRRGPRLSIELEGTPGLGEQPRSRAEDLLVELVLGDTMQDGISPTSHIAPGVPRVRTLLVQLAARAAGGDAGDLDEAAYSAELLNLALGVHDAALGRQGGLRRRVARRLLGGAAHWLGGNHLTLRALEVAQHAPAPELVGEVLETLREISEGQILADELRRRDPTLLDVKEYAEGHSGAVFAFCTRAGGRIAGAPRPVVSALGRYGRHMGVAWHAIEDLSAFWLGPEELLRELARATAAGRPVLPLIAAQAGDPELGALLDLALRRGDAGRLGAVKDRVSAAGGLYAARKMALEETLAARRALRAVPPSPHRDGLDQIARSLLAGATRLSPERTSGG
jgi:geranylgeranyl pyrophosphate synthase